MALLPTIDFTFKVRRCQPELITPAEPTPHEFKQLSDIDDQETLRFHFPTINLYKHNPSLEGRDPVKVIKEAIAKTLVLYYPFAGRLREGPGRELFVECTGEGILFVEADANVTLKQFCDALQPPFSCLDDVMHNVPNSDGIFDCPLLLIQVTRLKCGGFIFAIRFNHTMTDAFGLVQLMMAIGEMARGAFAPSIIPVWQRGLLTARDPPRITYRHPPRITYRHHEYDQVSNTKGSLIPFDNIAHRFIFFGPLQISSLRQTLPTHLRECSSFELITAYIWRLRTIALQLSPEEEVRFLCLVKLRSKFNSLPSGYYGNTCAIPAALTTAGKLCRNPLGYAVELIRKAKATMSKEYINSVMDLLVIKGRPQCTAVGAYVVYDLTRARFEEVDFGWGKAIFGGLTLGGVKIFHGTISFYMPFKNKNGDNGILVPLCLPAPAMERFMTEIYALLKTEQLVDEVESQKQTTIISAL